MASLITLQGPNAGHSYPLEGPTAIIGRQPDSAIYLESLAVSRHHAQIVCEGSRYFLEDLHSSNGTFVNGKRVVGRASLTEHDAIQIGPYVLGLRVDRQLTPPATPALPIEASIPALPSNRTLFAQNAEHKLGLVMEVARQLARSPDLDTLLHNLLDHLLALFPQSDRGLILLCEGTQLVERAHRGPTGNGPLSYSRTIVHRALDSGEGILCADVASNVDARDIATVMALKLRSFLCVPLIGKDGRRLGVIQLDCSRQGHRFDRDDLDLLTTLALQASVALDNAAMQEELLQLERLKVELGLAREIQQGFLPTNFPLPGEMGCELFARVWSAREVAGDLYDFFPLGDGRLAFYVGDVTGKGMPAALFMVAARSLCRHLAADSAGPADTLARLDLALAADNPSMRLVTMAYGIWDPKAGEVALASAAHPRPLLRRIDGRVEEVKVQPGLPLGCGEGRPFLADRRLVLAPGETLILYTDGFNEAANTAREMFGAERVGAALGGERTKMPLEACATEAHAEVERFTGQPEQQDDMTLLLLRRV